MRFTMKSFLTKFVAIIGLVACSYGAHAAPAIRGTTDVGEFFRFFCSNVKIRPGDLKALKDALAQFKNGLPKLNGDLISLKYRINPPSQCLDGIVNMGNIFPTFPGGDLSSCFNGLFDYKPKIELPKIDYQCINNMIPKLGSLPTFDRNKFNNTLSCLGNTFQITDLDLPTITGSMQGILNGIQGIGAALLKVLPRFEGGLGSPAFASSIRWTNNFCGRVNSRQIDLTKLSAASRSFGR